MRRSITKPGSNEKEMDYRKSTTMMANHTVMANDDTVLLSLLKMRLESAGHTVDTAENGTEGLTRLECADDDVGLLDDMMPEITGLTVLQHIQERHLSVQSS